MSNTYCQKYAAIVNAMRDPMNVYRIEQLNEQRIAAHEALAKRYFMHPDETRDITDNMPDMPTEQLAEWLNCELKKRYQTHKENIASNTELYSDYETAYHTWVNNYYSLMSAHNVMEISDDIYAKAKVVVMPMLDWIKRQMTLIAMGKDVDAISIRDKTADVCSQLARISPYMVARLYSYRLWQNIRDCGKDRLLINDAWLRFRAATCALPVDRFKAFVSSVDASRWGNVKRALLMEIENAVKESA